MTNAKRFLLSLICFMAGFGLQANAQSTHLMPRSMALGGGGAGYVEGYHANFVNPANLLLGKGDPRVTVGLIGGISTSAGGGLLNLQVYDTYFTRGLTLTGAVAEQALDDWFGSDPSQMKYFGMQADFVPFGLSVRNDKWAVSLAFRSRTMMHSGINKGFAQLALYGFDTEIFGEGRPVNFSASTMTFYEASLGLAIQILEIENIGFAKNVRVYAGAAPKLLLGANSYKLNFNSVLTLKGPQNEPDELRHAFNYRLETTGETSQQLTEYYRARESQADVPDMGDYVELGPEDLYTVKTSGFGLDLGATIEMDVKIPVIGAFFKGAEHLQIGLSLTDLGSLAFSENAGVFTAEDELVWRGFDLNEETIDKEYDGDRDEYINHVIEDSVMTGIYNSFSPSENSSFIRSLPTAFHLGSMLTLNRLSLSVDLSAGFNHEGINSRKLAVSTGLEYDLFGFLPLRVGMRTGGYSYRTYSAGIGLEFRNFEFSIAASAVGSTAKNVNMAAAWSGLVFKF